MQASLELICVCVPLLLLSINKKYSSATSQVLSFLNPTLEPKLLLLGPDKRLRNSCFACGGNLQTDDAVPTHCTRPTSGGGGSGNT